MRVRLRAGEVENSSVKILDLNCALVEMGK